MINALKTAGGPKRLARLAGVHVDTASRWWNGDTLPRADVFVALMKKSREIAGAVYAATTQEWQDAEEARLKAELAALQTRRGNDPSIGPVRSIACRATESLAEAMLAGASGLADKKQDRSAQE